MKEQVLAAMRAAGKPVSAGEVTTAPSYPLDKLRRKMGMVFQSFNLFEHMTETQNT